MICQVANGKVCYLYSMQQVQFIEASHKYFVDGKEYISATTLIDKYVPEFDEYFWSRYKAIERIFKERYGDSKGVEHFRELRNQRDMHSPGWESWMCAVEGIDDLDLDLTQNTILNEWREKNENSKIKGSAYHLEKENEAYNLGYSENPFTKTKVKTIKGSGGGKIDLTKLSPGYYPELIIWNNEYGVIGTADRVFVKGGTNKDPRLQIWIDDYKTNEEIKKQNMYEYMHYPLDKLQNCNYNHYRLQIGLYAYMLEQYGYNIRGISINHLGTQYKMRYSSVKKYVRMMLDHYAGKDVGQLEGVAKYGFSDLHLLKR